MPKGKDSVVKYQLRDGRMFVPATRVRINGKDTLIKTPLFYTFGKGKTVSPGKINLQGYTTIPYPHPDHIPTLKPDLSQYRMPNMIQPILKKPNTILLMDTVGKK